MDGSNSPRPSAAGPGERAAPAPAGAIAGVAACAAVALAPFAVLHLVRGEATTAWLHAAVALVLAGAAAFARRGGDARLAGRIGALATGLGAAALVALRGAEALPWVPAALAALFLLLHPREAAVLAALLVGGVTLAAAPHADMAGRVAFLVTAALVALGLHAFAARLQRHDAELSALATRDALTGAGNARALESELRLAAEAARREGRACGVAVMEVDHLALLAQRHGEDAATQVLVDLARVVGDATRRTDRFFRTAPETFVLLLPGADTAVLGPMLDSLRLRIGDALRVDGELVGVSIGAAALRAGEDPEAWLGRARMALGCAQAAGRGRVEVGGGTVGDDGRPIGPGRALH